MKLERIKNKAERLSKLPIDTQEKKRKAQEMKEENRLPKRWNSAVEHERTEGQVRENLEDVEQELALLRVGVELSPAPDDIEVTLEPVFI